MNHKIHPTTQMEDFLVSGNEHDRLNQMTERAEATMQVPQQSRLNQSKSEISKFNSEIHLSPYSIIERNKLNYVANYSRFEQMRVVENLAGIRPIEQKLELLQEFSQLFAELCIYLQTIQTTILGINFDEPNFQHRFVRQPKDVIETIYKDIKVGQTLESFHIEIVFNSSLRFLATVLEAQQIEHLMVNLNTIDIRSWQYSCTGHLLKFKVSPQLQRGTSHHIKYMTRIQEATQMLAEFLQMLYRGGKLFRLIFKLILYSLFLFVLQTPFSEHVVYNNLLNLSNISICVKKYFYLRNVVDGKECKKKRIKRVVTEIINQLYMPKYSVIIIIYTIEVMNCR